MTAVGVFNGNWRGEEMREYLNGVRSDNKKLAELGTCGHELGSRPMWMIGKSQLCYACYYNEEQEQRRILDNITEEAQAEYFDDEKLKAEAAALMADALDWDMQVTELRAG